MKTFTFWIKRTRESFWEFIKISAENSQEAINKLPETVDWHFSLTKKEKNKIHNH